ncbi:MAG: amidohydrolase family protein [Bacillota bacterium]
MAENRYRVWDAHVHLFPGKLFGAIWRWFESYNISMPYQGMNSGQVTEHLEKMGVDKAFLLVYAHKADVSSGINKWLHNFCEKSPMYFPLGSIHPSDRDIEKVVEEALDLFGFLGLKIHYLVSGIRADDPQYKKIYRALEGRGKMLVAHAGTAPIPSSGLGMEIFERVLYNHPEMTVQVAHLGHFELDRVAVLMEKYPNLYLDTAWALGNSYMQVDINAVRDLIMGFPDRILYGSDFPIIPEDPVVTVNKIIELSLPERITRQILYGNAENVVGKINVNK